MGCARLRRTECARRRTSCAWTKSACRCRTPCLGKARAGECNSVPGCQWRQWNRRARAKACYRAPRTTMYTFSIPGTNYRCHLHSMTCRARGCKQSTHVHPFCAHHARTILGLEVRPAGSSGCGLFAVQDFARGDLLAPYLGRRVPPGASWACPRSSGRIDNNVESPYDMGLPAIGGRDAGTVDASCQRSYPAMANHGIRAAERNAAMVYVRNLAQAGRSPAAAAAGGNRAPAPSSILLTGSTCQCRSVPKAGIVDGLWLQAERPIRAGTEVRLNYGPGASGLIRLRAITTPRLC